MKLPLKVKRAGFSCEKNKVIEVGEVKKRMFKGEKCELVINEKGVHGIHPSIEIESLEGWIDEV